MKERGDPYSIGGTQQENPIFLSLRHSLFCIVNNLSLGRAFYFLGSNNVDEIPVSVQLPTSQEPCLTIHQKLPIALIDWYMKYLLEHILTDLKNNQQF